jgi:hypothetical protein
MVKKMSIILLLALISCGEGSSSTVMSRAAEESEIDFDWLIGNWVRTNEEAGKETFESWEKENSSVYHGFGFTLIKTDTIWQEEIKLIKTGEKWNFEVTGKGESDPTVFRLTELSQNSFTSQNPEHDYPTEIRYYKSGETLKAIISGDGMEIPFEFERISN